MSCLWEPDEKKLIEFMKRNPEYIRYESYRIRHKGSVDDMWATIAETVKLPINYAREKWRKIKRNHYDHLRKKSKGVKSNSKYLDGSLSFLNKYYSNRIGAGLQEEPNVVVIDSDENSKDNNFFTLDLTMVDELLASRRHEDIEMSALDVILSHVCKRIDETLLPYEPPFQATAKLDEPETSSVISVESDSKMSSNSEEQADADFAIESQPHGASPAKVEQLNNTLDMETLLDIHRECDSTLFFCWKLARYVERLPKERQEEIRLKICCLVMEAELDEDE